MAYRVEIAPHAERQFRKLPKPIQIRISSALLKLRDEPFAPGIEKLAGEDELFRLRVGDYRIIYAVRQTILVVLVINIGHRRDVYRRLR